MVADERGAQPLVACWGRAIRAPFEEALRAGRLAVHAVAEAQGPVLLGPKALAQLGDPARLLANVNAPEDLAAIVSREVAGPAAPARAVRRSTEEGSR